VQHGSADTVVRAMNAFNGKCRFSGYASSETPWPIFKKKLAQLITSWTPPHMQELGSIGSKGACLHMREIVALRRLFFFLFFLISCASLQVAPLDRSSSLTAQMTRPRGLHVLFMVSLIWKIFFLIFYPKMWKIALCPMANSKGYNSGTVKDRCELFSPNRGFSGSRNRMASFKFTPDWPLLPWQPIVVISTQNWP